MSDSSNICLSCGLCCDGTLIGFVQLTREELPLVRDLLKVEEADGNGIFLQPCIKYCDGCTIYNERPKQCASFKCGLLKSVDQKEIDFNLAVEVVNEVKQLKISIEKKLTIFPIKLKSQSFYYKIVELKKLLQQTNSESLLAQNKKELISELHELDNLLLKNFDLQLN